MNEFFIGDTVFIKRNITPEEALMYNIPYEKTNNSIVGLLGSVTSINDQGNIGVYISLFESSYTLTPDCLKYITTISVSLTSLNSFSLLFSMYSLILIYCTSFYYVNYNVLGFFETSLITAAVSLIFGFCLGKFIYKKITSDSISNSKISDINSTQNISHSSGIPCTYGASGFYGYPKQCKNENKN